MVKSIVLEEIGVKESVSVNIYKSKQEWGGAGSVAKWLSLCTPLRRPRVQILARTWHRSSAQIEAASHIPQLEGPATKIYNYVPGGIWGDKAEKKN